MASAKGACLNHIAKESTDVKRLAQFYKETFGFEQVESPKFDCEVIWLKLGSSLYLHLIERNPNSKLPESPWNATSAVADPSNLPRGHHICIYVPNFDSILQNIKEKGIEVYEKTLPDGKTKQAFFFDPDAMQISDFYPTGVELCSMCRQWTGDIEPVSGTVIRTFHLSNGK